MGFISFIKNVIHGILAVVVIIPLALTMGADDKKGTVVESYETTNQYITEYGCSPLRCRRCAAEHSYGF